MVAVVVVATGLGGLCSHSQGASPAFKAIAFYTGTNEEAHTSFVREANRWFAEAARQSDFAPRGGSTASRDAAFAGNL